MQGGTGLQGDRCLRQDIAFEVSARAEDHFTGYLPEDVLRLGTTFEIDTLIRAHTQVTGYLKYPDVIGAKTPSGMTWQPG